MEKLASLNATIHFITQYPSPFKYQNTAQKGEDEENMTNKYLLPFSGFIESFHFSPAYAYTSTTRSATNTGFGTEIAILDFIK